VRVPEMSVRVIPGFNLLGNRLRVQFPIEYYGDRYADAANSVKLPSYRVFNAALRFDLSRAVTFHVNVDNIDNEIGLTERQSQVLALLVQGKPNKLICRQLNLAEGTVKIHVTAILKALGVANRTQAVIAVGKLGLKLPGL
jgi:DNA-binding NarL/FixJ family response regulator